MSKRILWLWCIAAFYAYLWLPYDHDHRRGYGRFKMWLLGYGGAYAHSEDYADFRDHAFLKSRS